MNSGRDGDPASIHAYAKEVLPPLCGAVGLEARAQEALGLFEAMTEPWGSRPIEDWLERRSSVSADQSPHALAFALGPHGPDVRFILEAQADEPSPAAQWSAGRALTKRLSERYGLALDPLTRVEDLFGPAVGARIWHTAVLRGDAPPRFELLFDAHAQGRWRARAVVEEALVRLGFGRMWPDVAERVLRRGLYLDDPAYFAIELPSSREAREAGPAAVELYIRHHEATPEDLRAALGVSPLGARVEELCLALTGSLGPYRARPVVSCHGFTDPAAPAASSCGIYVPVAAHAPSDAVVRGRVSACLALQGLPYEAYERALAGYARRPLGARAGMQSYVGLREEGGLGLSVSVELSPEMRPVSPAPEAAPGDLPRNSTEEIVHRFEDDIVLADHPFLRRLAREPVQLGPLWLMIANFWEGIVHDFPKRLAHVIAKIDDDRIRCVLTKQMNDELGEGDFERAHKPMFQTLLKAVEPYRLQGPDDVLLAPGRAFGRELGAMMFSDDPYEAVGAMMMIEIYGKQTDLFMASQFRRQDKLDSAALLWLHLHEGLEVDHAEDSFTLARCVPDDPAAIAAAWRGAEAIVTAGRHYFDAFYRICFA